MSSTIHDIFIRKVLHQNHDDLTNYVKDDQTHRELIQRFVRGASDNRSAVTVIAREKNLPADWKDPSSGVVYLTVEEAAESFISSSGVVSENNFNKYFEKYFQANLTSYGKIRIYSELKDYLWERGQSLATATLEQLWLAKTKEAPILLLSAYSVRNLPDNRFGLVYHCISNGKSQFISKDVLEMIQNGSFTFSAAEKEISNAVAEIPTIMDVLSAEIFHEARNPLSIIKTSSELIRELHSEGNLTAEALDAKIQLIEKSVARIDHILTLFGKRS